MLIDCDSCAVRGLACGDCVVTVLLGAPPDGVQLDAEERAALHVLAAAGLVPPLRLVVPEPSEWSDADPDGDAERAADADFPIPYGVAYRQAYAGPFAGTGDTAAEVG